jgi:hypothetical protein
MKILRLLFSLWMKLAAVLAWVNTRIILTVAFFLVFTPVGMILRLLKDDPLEREFRKDDNSYWKKKESREFKPLNYEKQF